MCYIGTLTVGRERRFAVFADIVGGADRLLNLFDDRCEETSKILWGVGTLTLTRLSAVISSSTVFTFEWFILLLNVP